MNESGVSILWRHIRQHTHHRIRHMRKGVQKWTLKTYVPNAQTNIFSLISNVVSAAGTAIFGPLPEGDYHNLIEAFGPINRPGEAAMTD